KHGHELAGIDLSEQRFYSLSKSDLWPSGGKVDTDAGSWWGSGMELSYGLEGKTAPSEDERYNIPLEVDCPYNPKSGKNELQLPQVASCQRGTIRVSNMSTQIYEWNVAKNGWDMKTDGAR